MAEQKTVLVTGSTGMIGSITVTGLLDAGYRVVGIDRREPLTQRADYIHMTADLGDKDALSRVFDEHPVDRVIHLAALAHTAGEKDLSWERYYHINVVCAENLFSAAAEHDVPVLFISTADVYGFVKGVVSSEAEVHPVTDYGKSKAMAEKRLKEIFEGRENRYTIFRFAPVYTDTIKRDIQKRYYLKYPKGAYLVGKGTEYEVLYIDTAVRRMTQWVEAVPENDTCNVKDDKRIHTADLIAAEKAAGKIKHVLRFPRWMVVAGVTVARMLTGKNKYTYLLNKVIHPLRTE